MADRSRVAVVGTGGTIAFKAGHFLDLVEYFDTGEMMRIDELIGSIDNFTNEIEIIPVEFDALPSDAVQPSHWLQLNTLLHCISRDRSPLDGIVITHGTSTIEETAYFLNLVAKIDTPLVLVGAQRPLNTAGSDAQLNLLNAIRFAAHPMARNLGAVIVHGNQIWDSREVSKVLSTSMLPFQSADLGILGYADLDNRVVLYRRPVRKHAPDTIFDVRALSDLPKVDIALAYAGAEGIAIDAFVAHHCLGLVVAGFLPGSATPTQEAALDRARQAGVAVALCGHGGGRVLARTLLRTRGIIAADNLSPVKARILMMMALTITQDAEQIQELFNEY